MDQSESGYHIGKLRRKINDMDLNEVNSQTKTPYNRNRQGKTISRSGEENYNFNELVPDNYSVKANSVQTSYQYHKKKCNNQNNNNENYPDSEMSDNSNLICPYCINSILADEKHKRENLDKNWQSNGLLEDKTKNYEQDLINKKIQQREKLTQDAIENLAKLNQNLSNKDKLIQMNESSNNPLDMRTDYKYQKFQDDYAKKQKLINDNLDKFYPNYNDRPEKKSYYDNYVYFPTDKNTNINNKYNKYGEYAPMKVNKKEYIKSLEDQINYKNEQKKKEKEEEQRREQKQFMNLQEQIKKEEQEKFIKEQKQKEELMRANMELINQKNKMKLKELEEKLKYKEACDKEEEEYKRELLNKELQKAKMRNDLCNEYNDKLNNEKYLQKIKHH